MKLIKKIAAIMFAFMMVVSMSCNVKADEGTTATTGETGTITINNAIPEQTYTIYKILDLESYDAANDNYSYKPAKGWNTFINQNTDCFIKNEYDGISWNVKEDETKEQAQERASKLAQKAIIYAKNISNGVTSLTKTPTIQNNTDGTQTLTYSNLELGYYLVDSSVGALCSLNTTNPTAKIEEKNDVPSVEKKIVQNNTDVESSFANIGETVNFKTTITAQKGAQSYVLHDTMDKAFTFNNDIVVQSNGVTIGSSDYTIYYDKNNTEQSKHVEDNCTFEIRFTKDYLDTLANDQNIVVTYSAILNGDANIGRGDHNATHLTYGDNKNTVDVTTTTYTSQIKVLKYTGDTTHVLAGAKFKLFKQEAGGEALTFVKKAGNEENYRLTVQGESGVAEIVTTSSGAFTMQGLKPGDYWLEETAAPKGYNKLVKRIKVVINDDGTLIVDGKDKNDKGIPISQVDVENKTGTVLPSTGGAGTTMIYLIGGALVLGSGVVLVTKRRVKGK